MRLVKKGATDQTIYFDILDSASTTGGRKTAIAYNAANLICYYTRAGAAAVQITLATQTAAGAHSDGGWVAVSDTNAPGVYRLDLPDAVCASGVDAAVVTVSGASGMVEASVEIQLVALDLQDGVRAGLTSLPNAAAEASGGLPTLSAAQASNGTIQSNVHRWLTGTPNALQSGRVDGYLGAVAAGVIAAASFAANALDAVWSTAARTLTAFGFTVATNSDSNVTAIKAKTDNLPASPAAVGSAMTLANDAVTALALAADAVAEIQSGLALDSTVAKDATVSKPGTAQTISSNADITAIKAKTDNLPASPAAVGSAMTLATDAVNATSLAASAVAEIQTGLSTLDAAGIRSAIGLAFANLDTQLDALPTAAEIRTEMDANSTKMANLDATISSRGTADPGDAMVLTAAYDAAKTASTQASLDALDLVADAIKVKTDQIAFSAGAVQADMVKVAGSTTVDGLAISAWFDAILAHAAGDVVRSVNTYNYKKQDGVTTAFSFTSSENGRS